MSAVPKQLLSMPKVSGIKGIDNKIHSIYPVNATGNTQFAYDGNNVISFMIPAYARGFFNPQRSFVHFNIQTQKGWVADGTPIFNRMVLRSGNGAVLEDIQGYSAIQRCLENFESVCAKQAKANITNDYSYSRWLDGKMDTAAITEINENGTTVYHQLLSGILGKSQQHYIPVGLFNASGGFAFELQLYLEDPVVCCLKTTGETSNPQYVISDVSLQMEIVNMPAQLTDRLDAELYNNNKVSIPYSTFRLHHSYIPSGSQQVELQVSESAHDLEAIYTLIRTQLLTTKTPTADDTDYADNLYFLGGHPDRTKDKNDAAFSSTTVDSYQFRYDTKYYPAKRAEMGDNDTKLALLNALHTLDKMGEDCYAGAMLADGKSNWDAGGTFCIIQNFKSSRDDYYNALNSSSTGAPVEMSLSLKKAAASALRVEHFVKSNYTLNIIKGGQTTLINGTVRNEETSA